MNLIKDKFVPVIQFDGKNSEMSLMDTLLNSHEINCVHSADSPLITAGILRTLTALVNRITDLKNEKEWHKAFDNGKFSPKLIKQYFEKYEDRFELYGKNAFLQSDLVEKLVKQKKKDNGKSVHWLAYLQAGNWPFLIHHNEELPMKLSDAEIARWLIARQNFSPSEGLDGVTFNYFSPVCDINNGTTFFITGKNLFETLMFNLYIKFSDEKWNNPNDIASWEMEKILNPVKTPIPVRGMSHILSWLTRYIKIQKDGTLKCIGGWRCGTENDPNGIYLTNKKGERKAIKAEQYKTWVNIFQLYNKNKTKNEGLVWAVNELGEYFQRDMKVSVYYLTMNYKKQKLVNWGESTLHWNKSIATKLSKLPEEDKEVFIEHFKQSIDISRTIFNAINRAILTLQKLSDNEIGKKKRENPPLYYLDNEYWFFAEQTFWEIIFAAVKTSDPIEFIDNNLTEEGEWGIKLVNFARNLIYKHLSSVITEPVKIYGPMGVLHTFETFKFRGKKTSKTSDDEISEDEEDNSGNE